MTRQKQGLESRPSIGELVAGCSALDDAEFSSWLRARGHTAPGLTDDALWVWAMERELFEDEVSERVGVLAGRYRCQYKLDGGGTASVWLAFDQKLRRRVAIKIFDRDNRSVEQILAEAKVVSDIISDHVVRIHDVRAQERGTRSDAPSRPFIVMELVGEFGEDDNELAVGRSAAVTRPRTRREAIRWVIQTARGISDAHRRNVFHRDIKPRNILITPHSRRALVTDFGLGIQALDLSDDPCGSISIQRPAQHGGESLIIAGTPAFMAPEQARGLPADLDPSSEEDRRVLVRLDVYGLGALAYTLVSGRPPYGGGMNATPMAVWERVCAGERPPPLRSLSHSSLGTVPRRLARIIHKAMADAPGDRYDNPTEFADALQAYLDHRPTRDEGGDMMLCAALWIRRYRMLSASIALVLFLIGAITVSYYELHALDRRESSLAEQITLQNDNLAALRAASIGLRRKMENERVKVARLRSSADGAQRATELANREAIQARGDSERAKRERQMAEKAKRQALKGLERARRRMREIQEQALSDLIATQVKLDNANTSLEAARVMVAEAEAEAKKAEKRTVFATARARAANSAARHMQRRVAQLERDLLRLDQILAVRIGRMNPCSDGRPTSSFDDILEVAE